MRAFNVSMASAALILATSAPALAGVNADAQLCRDAITESTDIDASAYNVKFERAKGGRVRVLRFRLSPVEADGDPLVALCTIERGGVSDVEFTAAD